MPINYKSFLKRLTQLVLGLFLYAFGIVVSMSAQIGYAPWEVFHAGISKMTGLTIGTASIIVGIVIVIIACLLGEKLGLGTLLNMILIGVFMDIIISLNFIPKATNFAFGLVMLPIGMFTLSLATYFYMRSGFGSGPRDSLMVAIKRKTKLPVGICRAGMEFLVVVVGWACGGMVGMGTIISAFAIGLCMQLTFKLLKFDPTLVKHETLRQTFLNLAVETTN